MWIKEVFIFNFFLFNSNQLEMILGNNCCPSNQSKHSCHDICIIRRQYISQPRWNQYNTSNKVWFWWQINSEICPKLTCNFKSEQNAVQRGWSIIENYKAVEAANLIIASYTSARMPVCTLVEYWSHSTPWTPNQIYVNGLVQDCNNSSALALSQSCTKSSIYLGTLMSIYIIITLK